MKNITKQKEAVTIYLVQGSGLMAVPSGRINEIPRLKQEFHAGEVAFALAAARARKPA